MLEILGVGLDPHKHCTPDAIETIRKADVNITFDPIGNIVDFLLKIGGRIDNIEHLYPDHLHRRLYYRKISEYVVESTQNYRRVVYLTYGNPCILDEPVANIIQKCRELGIEFKIHPNISFLDEILALNFVCVGYRGLRMCTARAIAESAVVSSSDELLVISQPIELGSLDGEKILRALPSDLVILSERLLETRGNSHAVITQATTDLYRSHSLQATVATLPFFALAMTTLTSIIVLPR